MTAAEFVDGIDVEEPDHPAKFTLSIVQRMAELIDHHVTTEGIGRPGKPYRILDPFAGVGRVHLLRDLCNLPCSTVGVELEPEWADPHPRTVQGNALDLDAAGIHVGDVDILATSPCYGNRMADSFEAKDGSKRHTYHHRLGRRPSPGSAAVLRWGPAYRKLHLAAWREAVRVMARPGLVVVNVSNHLETLRKGGPVVEWPVVEWHLKAWLHLGAVIRTVEPIATPRQGMGANGDVRCESEFILVLLLPEHPAPER